MSEKNILRKSENILFPLSSFQIQLRGLLDPTGSKVRLLLRTEVPRSRRLQRGTSFRIREILTKHIAPQQESLPDSPSRLHFCLLQSRKRTNYKETYKVSQKTSFQKFQVFAPLHHLPKQTKTVPASMPFQIFDHKYCIGLSWKIMDRLDHASVQNLKSKNKNLK